MRIPLLYFCLAGLSGVAGATPYVTTPIVLPGYQTSEAADVSENGFVAVTGRDSGWRAFLWSKAGGAVLIPKPAGIENMFATSVNNSGQVVGRATVVNGYERGFLFTPGVGTTLLDLPSGVNGGYASSINNSGEIVGQGWDATTGVGIRWSSGGGISTSAAPPGYAARVWKRINDANQIVGDTAVAFQGWRATYVDGVNEKIYDLPPTFQAAGVTGLSTTGLGLGTVSKNEGSFWSPDRTTRSFVFDGNTVVRELIPSGGVKEIHATSINASGTISATLLGPALQETVLYLNGSSTPTVFSDLVGDGISYTGIYDLNDSGQLTTYGNNNFHFAEPVPEPSGMVILSGAVLAFFRRRKQNH